MIRVACVIPSLALGGAERSLVGFANIVRDLGADVSVILFKEEVASTLAESLDASVTLSPMGCFTAKDPRLWWRLRGHLKDYAPDALVGWSLYANLVGSWITRDSDPWRLVLSERLYGGHLGLVKSTRVLNGRLTARGRLVRHLYRRADVITANSRGNLRYMRTLIGPGPRYRLLPNTVDTDAVIRGASSPAQLPAREGPRVLGIGRLDHQKGFDVLLRALALVRRQHPWAVAIAGDGPERSSLEQLASRLGIAEAVTFLGEVPHSYPYYGWADIVVVPSRYEGFPNVLLEAMASGKAVVAADCRTGPRELTQGGRFGLLVPVEDAESLALALISLAKDPERVRRLGVMAQLHVRETYDSRVVAPLIRGLLFS